MKMYPQCNSWELNLRTSKVEKNSVQNGLSPAKSTEEENGEGKCEDDPEKPETQNQWEAHRGHRKLVRGLRVNLEEWMEG
jgi:hypothetical protein